MSDARADFEALTRAIVAPPPTKKEQS